MIKGLQTSLKQLIGLKLDEDIYKIWIYYFTEKACREPKSIKKNTSVYAHFERFNFLDVPIKAIFAEGRSVEQNPKETLPILLRFEQPIEKHYFEFCKLLLSDKKIITLVIAEIGHHLYRALIAFTHQFFLHYSDLLNSKETAFFPLKYFEGFPYLLNCLFFAPSEKKADTYFLLSSFLNLVSNDLPNIIANRFDVRVQTCVYRVFQLIIEHFSLISDTNGIMIEMCPIIFFALNYLVETFSFHPGSPVIFQYFPSFLTFVSRNSKKTDSLPSDMFPDLISLSIKCLSFISQQVNDEEFPKWFDISILIITTIESISPLKITMFPEQLNLNSLISTILLLVDRVSDFESLKDLEEPSYQPNVDYLAFIPTKDDYEFCSDGFLISDLYRKHMNSIPEKVTQFDPTYLENANLMINLILKLSSLCSKDDNILSGIIVSMADSFTREKSLKLHYIGTLILMNNSSKSFSYIMSETDSWKMYITASVINQATVTKTSNILLFKLKEMLFSISYMAYSSQYNNQNALVHALGALIKPQEPYVIHAILNLFFQFMSNNYEKFLICVENSGILDNLLRIFVDYKEILKKNPSQEIAIQVRTLIVVFIHKFFSRPVSHKQAFCSDKRMFCILTMLFETNSFECAVDLLGGFLRTMTNQSILRQVNILIRDGCQKCSDSKWKTIFITIIDTMEESLRNNYNSITNFFFSSGCLTSFSMIPMSYINTDDSESKRIVYDFLKRVIRLIIILCRKSQKMQNSLSHPTSYFRSNIQKALSFITIDDSIINLLLSLSLNDMINIDKASSYCHITCVEGLSLLYSAVEGTPFHARLLEFLNSITCHSISNRYQCFQSNIIGSLLKFLPQNPTKEAIQLFTQLGTSFFRMSELSLTIWLLKNTSMDYVLPLLNTLQIMAENHNKDAPSSFFHFGHDDPSLTINDFNLSSKFSVSSLVDFDPETIEVSRVLCPFFIIYSNNQRIVLSVQGNSIFLDIVDSNCVDHHLLFNGLVSNSWSHILLSVSPYSIKFYLNLNMKKSIELTKKFSFGSSKVNFQCAGSIVNIEDLCLYNSLLDDKSFTRNGSSVTKIHPKTAPFAKFNAFAHTNDVFMNLITNDVIESATFSGLVVPFSISLVETIPTCGGPRILLPLFSLVSKSKDPVTFLLTLMKLVRSVINQDENMFLNQRFFRSLGHLLSELENTILSRDCLELLYDIYNILHSQALKEEMCRYIWRDFGLWERLSLEDQLFVYSGLFTGLVQVDPKTISNVISFSDFLVRFTSLFNRKQPQQIMLNRCWSFLRFYAQYSLTLSDAKMLLASAITTSSPLTAIASSESIRDILTDANTIMIECLKEYGFFPPFTQILNAQNEDLRVLGTHLMYYIQIKADVLKPIDLGLEMINAIRMYYNADQIELSLHLCLSYIFGIPDHTQSPDLSYRYDFGMIQMIKYPQFLPLLCILLQPSSIETKLQITKYILESLNMYEQSRIAFADCTYWIIWSIYLSNLDGNADKWICAISGVIVSSIKSNPNYNFESQLTLLNIVCSALNMNSTKTLRFVLSNLVVNIPSVRVFKSAIQFILFVPEDDYELRILKHQKTEPQIVADVIQGLAQHLLSMKDPDFSSYVFTRMTPSDPWEDYHLAVNLTSFLISLGEKVLFENSQITISSVVDNFTLCSYMIREIGRHNHSEADQLFEKIFLLIQKAQNKHSLVNSLLILLDFYSYKCDNSDKLIQILCQIDNTYIGIDVDGFCDICEKVCKNIYDSLHSYIDAYTKEHKSNVMNQLNHLRDDFSYIFNNSKIDRTLFELKQEFRQNVSNMEIDSERILRGNAKFWTRVMKEMADQIGSPWADNKDMHFHFKTDNSLDSIGRRLKMKRLHSFNDHLDASKLRDNNVKVSNTNVPNTLFVAKEIFSKDTDEPNNRENTHQIECQMITISHYFSGTMFLGNGFVAFEASSAKDSVGNEITRVQKIVEISIEQISFILKRRYLHRDLGAEIFTTTNKPYFFVFANDKNRLSFLTIIKKMEPPNIKFIQFKDSMKFYHEMNLSRKWRLGEVSNYEYLYWLNVLSGRSINDLSQYPVFPWVLSDYNINSVDLNDPKFFRDLSIPVGALNPERLSNLLSLYNDTKDQPYSCIYRFHYSAPAYVINYLIRLEPFTSLHIALQNGRFDHANRLFSSIGDAYESCISPQSDFREVIPEFFSGPEFLLNSERFDLGILDDGVTNVDDVRLPKWASNAASFVATNRMALESQFVCDNLHNWIDLIFGYKQRGQQAILSNNLFHPYSYSSSITEEILADPDYLETIQQHAANFGIIPDQLFIQPHPPRKWSPPKTKLMGASETKFEAKRITQFQNQAIKMKASKSEISILFSNGVHMVYVVGEGSALFKSESLIDIPIPPKVLSPIAFDNHISIIPKFNFILISTPWSRAFQLYSLESKKSKPVYAPSAHSCPVTSIDSDYCGKDAFAVTAASDSSLISWDLNRKTPRSRIVAHTSSIIDVAMSASCDLVASCDASGALVVSCLSSGALVHNTMLDSIPRKVMISPNGFIVLLFDLHEETSNLTRIVVTDFGTRKLADRIIEGYCTACCMVDMIDSSSSIALAQETKVVYILNTLDLKVKSQGPICDIVSIIEFVYDQSQLVLILQTGELFINNLLE